MKSKKILLGSLICACCTLSFSACSDDDKELEKKPVTVKKLSDAMTKVRDYAPKDAVVGHRGTAFWAPESTEAAYRWAREAGVDYLEADLQLTKDGIVVIVHDDNILDKTDVKDKFPDKGVDKNGKKVYYVKDFTLEELRQLDAGSWFNNKDHATEWRASYAGLKILTLQDLVMIAKGNRIKYDDKGNTTYEADPEWKGNVPGIYLETKEPRLNPGQDIEKKLYNELDKFEWNIVEFFLNVLSWV